MNLIKSSSKSTAQILDTEMRNCLCCNEEKSFETFNCELCKKIICGSCVNKRKCHLCTGRDECPRRKKGTLPSSAFTTVLTVTPTVSTPAPVFSNTSSFDGAFPHRGRQSTPTSSSSLSNLTKEQKKESRRTWTSEFMKLLSPKKEHSFETVTFKTPKWCDVCATSIGKEITEQSYVCGNCTKAVCQKCLANAMAQSDCKMTTREKSR
jgi:hypothetical protein